MRKTFTMAAAALLCATSASAMGGGGGGGYGNFGATSTPTFDDYTVAKRLIHHDDYAKAIPHLMAALQKRPHDADILNYLGYTHRMVGVGEVDAARDGDFKMSLEFYNAALQIDPNHKGVHEYLGELYLQMHDLNAAHHEMNELVILCPDGCDERDTLTKALAAYVPPPAPAPTANP
jgi:tetratricopeptide (TPR) repeat protein